MSVSAADNVMIYEKTQDAGIKINVEDYLYLVNRIAYHIMARMPSNVQVEDLMQAGMVGLLEASQKYDASKGASFETYAGIRIRGAIVDEMRRGDWAPRSVHRNSRRVAEAIKRLESRLGRDAKDTEVAAELEVSVDEYHDMLRDGVSTRLFSLEETYEEDESRLGPQSISEPLVGPAEGVQRQSMKKALAQAISDLPEREQLVLSLYYDKELNLKEIGRVLGVSESRVSQIHSQAAMRLRVRLVDW